VVVLLAIFADVIAPYPPNEQFRDAVRAAPAWADGGSMRFVLGTDSLGRDMLSRLIHGARISLFIGLSVMGVSFVIGGLLGLACVSLGNLVDVAITRVMDLIMAVPSLVLAILVVAVLGPSLTNTIVAVTIVYLPRYVRLLRAAALAELGKDYVTAARVAGVGPWRLMFTTVLPNCLAPLIVQAALGVSDAILEAAALGFLGLGAQPPTAEPPSPAASELPDRDRAGDLDLETRIGLGIPVTLSLGQHLAEGPLFLGHLAQDIVGRPVDDSVNRQDAIRGQALFHRADDRDAAAHAGLKPQIHAGLLSGPVQFLPVHGEERLVRRHDRLPLLKRLENQRSRRFVAADQLHDDVHRRIVDHLIRAGGQNPRPDRNAPVSLKIKIRDPDQLQRHAEPATDLLRPFRQNPDHAGSDRPESDEAHADFLFFFALHHHTGNPGARPCAPTVLSLLTPNSSRLTAS